MTARRTLQIGLAVRAAYGAAALLAPDRLSQAVGVPLEEDPRYLNALFGGRDLSIVAAGLGLLKAGREREALLLAASCELTDLVALLQELRKRGSLDSTTLIGAVFNAQGWVGVGAAARQLGR